MKNISFLTIFLYLSLNSYSQQYFFAGDQQFSHIDLNPDTVISSGCIGSQQYWVLESFAFDVSGDGINDGRLYADCSWSQYGYDAQYLGIVSLNTHFFLG